MDALGLPTLALCAAFVALGGVTKGVIGLGMPLVAVPLLSSQMPVPDAIAVMTVPMLFTNLYQMVEAGRIRETVRRFRGLLLMLAAGIVIGAFLLTSLRSPVLSGALGAAVMTLALTGIARRRFVVPASAEAWAGPVVGLFSGLLGGVAGLWGPPLGAYLASLRLDKDNFIGAVGTSFGLGAIVLLVSLVSFGAFGWRELPYSAAATLPAFAGLFAGQRIRAWIPQALFRVAVLATLAMTGAALMHRAIVGA